MAYKPSSPTAGEALRVYRPFGKVILRVFDKMLKVEKVGGNDHSDLQIELAFYTAGKGGNGEVCIH